MKSNSSRKKSNSSRKKSKLRITFTILAFVFMIAGIALVLFPPVSNSYGKYVANSIADDFDTRVENIKNIKQGKKSAKSINSDDDGIDYIKIDIDALYKDSLAYNKNLQKNQRSLLTSEDVFNKPALSLSKYGIYDGVYGYISISAINLKIPIYLGIQNNHMSYGSAHLTYTSLPIGDSPSNCVLAGHTGYVGRIFFDDIRQLKNGDTVKIVNYWGTINYKVTGNKVVAPDEADDYFITDDKANLILVTCISNDSGGFDRYLVFCQGA
jgi:sortase A